MAQLVLRYFLAKYSIVFDFALCFIGVSIHQLLDISTAIDYEKRKYDTVFFLTCLVLVSRIIVNVGVLRDKKMIENDLKKEELQKLKIENERNRLENEKLRKELNS